MKFSKAKRLIAACLVGAGMLSGSATALSGGFTYTYPIGAGTTYMRQEGYNASGLQKASVITYQPNESVSPIGVRSGEQFYGSRQTISQAASSLEAKGYDVIGGINADFFSFSDGVPTGLFIDHGRVITSTDWEAAVGFMADGSAIIGDPISNILVSGESGKIAVFDYNKTRTTRGLCLLDRYYSDTTHFGSPGQSIIMEYEDFSTLKIGQPITLTVVDKVSGSSSFEIGENQMVLSRRDDCTSMPWIDFQIGERVTIDFQTSDPRWGEVQYAVGGKTLISNGSVTTNGIDSASSLTARSAVGVKSNGTVVLYEVDGKQSSYSKGLTAKQLADELTSLGCVSALALDGGGSSAMTIQNPASGTVSTVTRPADGSERKCSTYIFLVNNASSDGVPASIHLEPVSRYVLPGGSVKFSATVLDGAFHKTTASDEILYTASAGSVQNGTYTAPTVPGSVTVSASSGAAAGSMDLYVTNEPTSMALLKNGTAVSSLSMKAGDTAQIDAVVYRNGVPIASVNPQMVWSVSGGIGTISNSGLFTAAKSGTGTINVSCYGVSKSISISVGMGEPQELTVIADFEDGQPFSSPDATLSRTTSGADVARGFDALQAQISGGAVNVAIPAADTAERSALTLWAKLSAGSGDLQAVFENAAGEPLTVSFSTSVQTSYRQLKAEVPADAVRLTGLHFQANGAATLWLDHILLSEYAVTNTDAPSITITDNKTAVNAGESAYITAKILQDHGAAPVRPNRVRAYIDGKLSSATYHTASAAIDVKTGSLSAGTHVIVLEAEDDAGNRSRKSVTVTAGTRTDSKFTDIGTSWAAGYINLLADRGIMSGEQLADGTMRFHPNNNLRRSEFAVLMAKVLELDTSSVGNLPFDDAASLPQWAKASIAAVTKAGVMSGQSNPNTGAVNFNPNAEITRAEVMSVISRCLPRGYVTKSEKSTDASSIPAWAKSAVSDVTSAGIINGYTDGTIKPNAKITRAEIASVICNFK